MPRCAPPEAINQICQHLLVLSSTPSRSVNLLRHPSEPPSGQIAKIDVTIDHFSNSIQSIDQVRIMISMAQIMMANPRLCPSGGLPETLASLKQLLRPMELMLLAYQHTDLVHSLSRAIHIEVEECCRLLNEFLGGLTNVCNVLSNVILYFICRYMWARFGWQGSTTSTLESKLRKSHSLFAACLLVLGR